jgi:hypothetical protein
LRKHADNGRGTVATCGAEQCSRARVYSLQGTFPLLEQGKPIEGGAAISLSIGNGGARFFNGCLSLGYFTPEVFPASYQRFYRQTRLFEESMTLF